MRHVGEMLLKAEYHAREAAREAAVEVQRGNLRRNPPLDVPADPNRAVLRTCDDCTASVRNELRTPTK
jgi:hypothetical protein